MEPFHQRRINITSSWASSRIENLDRLEKYEDSYAITQEFREWIVCINLHPEHLEGSLLFVPNFHLNNLNQETIDSDELLEL